MANISLLILERGSRWIERAQCWRKPANTLMVVSQQGDEPTTEFRTRVEHRLERLRRGRSPVEQVMVLSGTSGAVARPCAAAKPWQAILAALSPEVDVVLDRAGHDGSPGVRPASKLQSGDGSSP